MKKRENRSGMAEGENKAKATAWRNNGVLAAKKLLKLLRIAAAARHARLRALHALRRCALHHISIFVYGALLLRARCAAIHCALHNIKSSSNNKASCGNRVAYIINNSNIAYQRVVISGKNNKLNAESISRLLTRRCARTCWRIAAARGIISPIILRHGAQRQRRAA
jgi:hypothetical protein